jgi:fungal STAND N-terminal Goodbye domain
VKVITDSTVHVYLCVTCPHLVFTWSSPGPSEDHRVKELLCQALTSLGQNVAILGRPPVPISPALMSTPNFESILNAALDSYAKQTGIDLTKHPSANKLQNCSSPNDVLQILSERESAFKDYRDQYRNLINRVRPVVQVVHALSAILGEMASLVSSAIVFFSSSRIFTPHNRCHFNQRVRYLSASTSFCRCVSPILSVRSIYDTALRQAAIGVSASYDGLADLLECVSDFLKRFQIYAEKVSLSPAMSDIVVKIMVEVLSVLALATKQINQGRFSKWYWHTANQYSPF